MLDSVERIGTLDSRGMLRMVAGMPDHLAVGYESGLSTGLKDGSVEEVVICGLGGSAIGGDLAAAWVSESSSIPVSVVRSYSTPSHVGSGSLVVAVSYSGDTEETLSMAKDASARGAKLVAVSSGGRLSELAEAEGTPLCRVPPGLVPRATVGYMFGTLSGILERVGAAEAGAQLDETRALLSRMSSDCGPGAKTVDNPAKKLAHSIHGTVPVIVGYGLSRPVATRWANQLNENAKMIAFGGELPEMDHNGIVGWVGDPKSQGFSMVFLDHDLRDPRMGRRVGATKDMVGEHLRVYSSEAAGSSAMAKMFSLICMGDYMSIYAAVLRGEDPSTTAPIDRLKEILSR